jgi:hypothetical protein
MQIKGSNAWIYMYGSDENFFAFAFAAHPCVYACVHPLFYGLYKIK